MRWMTSHSSRGGWVVPASSGTWPLFVCPELYFHFHSISLAALSSVGMWLKYCPSLRRCWGVITIPVQFRVTELNCYPLDLSRPKVASRATVSIKHKNEIRSLPRIHPMLSSVPVLSQAGFHAISLQPAVPVITAMKVRAAMLRSSLRRVLDAGAGARRGALFGSPRPIRTGRCGSPGVRSGDVGVRPRRAKGIHMACGEPRGVGTELPALPDLALFVLGKGQLLLLVPACSTRPGLTDLFSMTHAGKTTVSFPQFPHLLFVFLSLPS